MSTTATSYTVTGMTCSACVSNVKRRLEALPEVTTAEVQLAAPQAEIAFSAPVTTEELQAALGHYRIEPAATERSGTPAGTVPATATAPTIEAAPSFLTTYRPLLLIVAFIAGTTLLAQYPFADFSGGRWMRHFMAGFFIVFAFFKLLNLRGFADSYAMYDVVAARWRGWGYVYPFVELALGVLYLINVFPFWTNVATVVILGVSSIGVIESNLNKRKIKCACLGDVFNLPMSTVTIVEDVGMVAMAAWMLFRLG